MKFLFLFASLLSSVAQASWSGAIITDDMTDEKSGTVMFVANENRVATEDILFVICTEERGIIPTMRYSFFMNSAAKLKTIYRFDKEKPKSVSSFTYDETVFFGADRQEILELASDFIRNMIKGSSIVIHMEIGEETKRNTYSLMGFSKVFRDACSWHPDYDGMVRP